jgi:hypothetical protein
MAALCAVVPFVAAADAARTARMVRIGWPPVALKSEDGERISAIELTVTCGRFRRVTNIPDDWSLEVVSPSSEQTTLRASAGHGASELWDLRPLERVIWISIKDDACFDVRARITVGTADVTRHLDFGRDHLKLSP